MTAFISVVSLLCLASLAAADNPATLDEIEAEALSVALAATQRVAGLGLQQQIDAWVQLTAALWASTDPAELVIDIRRLEDLREDAQDIGGAGSAAVVDQVTDLIRALKQLDRGMDKVQRQTKQNVTDKVEEGRDIILQQTAYIEDAQPEPEVDACEPLLDVSYSVGHASYKTINGKCYRFVPSTSRRWGSAQENCHESGMEILQIESQQEQDAIRSVMLNEYSMSDSWIGAKKFPPHQDYLWMGGSHAYFSAGYSNWYRLSPDEHECVVVTEYGGFMAWYDTPCDGPFPYVCELYIY